tara:strand:+ start:48 stop:185 length:138 start_codon:yes stop_codon:yes gene_type:complete
MKLYWRYKKNGKWVWKPADAELCVFVTESYWRVPEDDNPMLGEEE